MSVILITNHDENIYTYITEEEKAKLRFHSPRYVSKHNEAIKTEYKKRFEDKTSQHATLGLPEHGTPDPSEYLRKGTGKPPVPPMEKFKAFKKDIAPCVTTVEEARKRGEMLRQLHKEKNYINKNVNALRKIIPKDPLKHIKPYQSGRKQELSENFGRTPKYLQNMIKVRARHMQMRKDLVGVEQPKCRYITRQEREELLSGLKQNWEELQMVYQGLPILTDTIPKINRKSKMEADLKQLEKDIVLVERHPYIYVYDDAENTPAFMTKEPCFCCKLQQRGKPVCSKGEKLPPLPDLREARTCKATQTDRNFVCENVKYVVEELVPKRPRKYVVYSKNGDKEDIFGVLEPKYIYSTKFGKAPAYLRKMVKVREEKKKEKVEERNAEDTVRIRCVSSEERERILKGLKHNLEEVMKEYLRLPIFTDTLPKINKKLRLEADIKQLEKDIELVEKHPCIYVYDE